jgi:hypothetical protein
MPLFFVASKVLPPRRLLMPRKAKRVLSKREEQVLTKSTANYLHHQTSWATQRIANHLHLSLRKLNELLMEKDVWIAWEKARKHRKERSEDQMS